MKWLLDFRQPLLCKNSFLAERGEILLNFVPLAVIAHSPEGL